MPNDSSSNDENKIKNKYQHLSGFPSQVFPSFAVVFLSITPNLAIIFSQYHSILLLIAIDILSEFCASVCLLIHSQYAKINDSQSKQANGIFCQVFLLSSSSFFLLHGIPIITPCNKNTILS